MTTSWVLTCYGQPADGFEATLDDAKRRASHHLRRTCPYGPMPWATTITWHQTTLPELGGRYVSSAGGSWLNHHLIPVRWPPDGHTMTKIDPAGPPPIGAELVARRARRVVARLEDLSL